MQAKRTGIRSAGSKKRYLFQSLETGMWILQRKQKHWCVRQAVMGSWLVAQWEEIHGSSVRWTIILLRESCFRVHPGKKSERWFFVMQECRSNWKVNLPESVKCVSILHGILQEWDIVQGCAEIPIWSAAMKNWKSCWMLLFRDKTRKITEAGNSRLIAEFRLFWFLTRYTDLGIIQKLWIS